MKEKKNQITEGIIWKQLLLFFFPIVFGTLFQQVYNTADTIIVGRFVGKEALAAVGGSASQIVNLVVGFFVGLASGVSVMISQFFGAKDKQNLQKTLHTSMAFCIVASVVFMMIGIAMAEKVLLWTKTPEDVMKDSVIYVKVYFAGIFFNLLYNMGSGILRAVGDSKRPLYVLITTCVMNIFLDILFVVVFKLGVSGVAIATVLSQMVSGIIIIIMLLREKESCHLNIKEIKFHTWLMRSILIIGVPAGMESVMYNISNILIQTAVNSLGTDTVAAWGTLGKIDAIFWMVINAFTISITTFVGQNFGAGKIDRMRKSVKVCMAMSIGTSVVMAICMLFGGKYIFRLFTNDLSVINHGIHMQRFLVPSYPLYVIIGILSGALRGTGNVLVPMILTCGGVCSIRIIWLMTVVAKVPCIETIMLNYPVSWIFTAILFVIYYWKKFPKTREDILKR